MDLTILCTMVLTKTSSDDVIFHICCQKKKKNYFAFTHIFIILYPLLRVHTVVLEYHNNLLAL